MNDKYNNIPDILRSKPNWVIWGLDNQALKVPYDPTCLIDGIPMPAKAGIGATWGTFQEAVECVTKGLAQGIGYEFDGGGLYGMDLDNVIDENGKIKSEAQEIIDQLDSYTEISPSGKGVHIWVLADGVDITRHRRQGGLLRYITSCGILL